MAKLAALSEQTGAQILTAQADVSDEAQVKQLLDRFAGADRDTAAEWPALKGLIHAAGVLDDGVLQAQTPERLAQVFAAKALGALHLDRLTGP